MLEACSLGLGTVCIGLFDYSKVKDILNNPQDEEVIAMPLLGYPKEDPKPPSRASLDDYAQKNG